MMVVQRTIICTLNSPFVFTYLMIAYYNLCRYLHFMSIDKCLFKQVCMYVQVCTQLTNV